ncbi:sarcosine oxidase subunit delta [Azospirillum sp. ST 5-10]|uniref:sarcosine oxidase subunit delta n=1 Tax=unclassified Azospirillum TaxID=2630922 RepID=UPI003F49E4AE
MRIRCPHCGERDGREFTYRGDATVRRPDGTGADPADMAAMAAMTAYVHQRTNPAGEHRELWYHTPCRTWVRVTRDTRTHAVLDSAPAAEATP